MGKVPDKDADKEAALLSQSWKVSDCREGTVKSLIYLFFFQNTVVRFIIQSALDAD